jgi:hypothetical protein
MMLIESWTMGIVMVDLSVLNFQAKPCVLKLTKDGYDGATLKPWRRG